MRKQPLQTFAVFLVSVITIVACTQIETGNPPLPSNTQSLQTLIATTVTPTHLASTTAGVILGNELSCVRLDDRFDCADKTLDITFEYPQSWGEAQAFSLSGDIGRYYYYEFASHLVDAGGASPGFSRENTPPEIGGYTGFMGETAEHYCRNWEALAYQRVFLHCNVVQASVVLTIIAPAADTFCFPSGRSISAPIVKVRVDLPSSGQIGGMEFSSALLSSAAERKLSETVSTMIGPRSENCTEENMKALNQYVDAMIDQIRNRTYEAETVAKLDQLEHFAESIKIIR